MSPETANLRLQSEQHPIIASSNFASIEGFAVYLIHLRAYEEAGRLAAGKCAIDWGCNDGYGLEVMLSFGCTEFYGMDISPTAIQAAKARLGAGKLIRCDGRDAPIRSGAVDLVTSFQVIEHISDRDQYLTEIARVLKPGALAMFTTPNAAIRLYPDMKPWNEFHVREFLHDELASVLKPHFSRVEVKGLFGAEELHRTELERCDRARQAALNPKVAPDPLWRHAMRTVFPAFVVRFIRKQLAHRKQIAPDKCLPITLPPWSTSDLSYRTTDLSSALDFMAVCEK
jgi:SAM-dependent methyltransferase